MDITQAFLEAVNNKAAKKGISPKFAVLKRYDATHTNFIHTATDVAKSIDRVIKLAAEGLQCEQQHLSGSVLRTPTTSTASTDLVANTQELLSLCGTRIETLKNMANVESQVTAKLTILNFLDDDTTPFSTNTKKCVLSHPQGKAHTLGVVMCLMDKLARATQLANELRAIQLSRTNKTRTNRIYLRYATPRRPQQTAQNANDAAATTPDPTSTTNGTDGVTTNNTARPNSVHEEEYQDEFGSSEAMAQENQNLLLEMDDTLNKIRLAETRLHEIAALSSLFSTKIEEQASEIEQLYDETIATSTNITAANQLLAQTNTDSVDFRIWILFFLITASLSLLFLDWYES